MKRTWLSVFLVACLLLCGGCTQQTSTAEDTVFYYLDTSTGALATGNIDHLSEDGEESVAQLLDALRTVPIGKEGTPILDGSFALQTRDLSGGVLTLDVSGTYDSLPKAREVLVRAGLVRTLVQAEGVRRVTITVDGEPLLDAAGNEVGPMRGESFIDNSAQQVNNYERDTVVLYFTDDKGEALIAEPRAIYHSSSQPLEWAVVQRLVDGPKVEGNYPVMTTDVEIISVSTAQGICYVNLSGAFLNNTLAVSDAVPVYAIVNSLVESCHVDGVQFSVEGDAKVVFRDTIDLGDLIKEDTSLIR